MPMVGPMVTVAPGHVIAIFEPGDSWIVAMLEMAQLRIIGDPFDGVILDVPVNAIVAAAVMDVHLTFFVVTAEYSGKFTFKRNNSTVENAI